MTLGQRSSYAHIDGKQVCRKEKKMTNALSMRTRLLVAVVALGLALAGSTAVSEDAQARYAADPMCSGHQNTYKPNCNF
jgi:hypothetical protein